AVQRRVWHCANALGDAWRHIADRLKRLLALVERARPAGDEGDEGLAVPRLRDEWQGWRDLEGREAAEAFVGLLDELAVEAQQRRTVLELKEHRTAVDVLDRVQCELQRREYAEVPAAAPDGPEEVFVLPVAGLQEAAVGGDHVGGDKVVDRQSAPAREIPDAAAEREPGDTCGRDDPAGRRESERMRGGVEVTPRGTALSAR